MIQLPNYSWFIQKQGEEFLTNTYSGSLGTDSQEGCMNRTTFNCKAFVVVTKENGPIAFRAECFWIKPWKAGAGTTALSESDFDVSQDGINLAASWIEEQNLKGCVE